MIANIPAPKRTNNKVIGEFYPLQKEELIALRQAKLINNTAFIHLALRYENPFCDRPVEIIPKEFALRWCIPESSVYEAIGKLKKLGVLLLKRGKVIIEWVVDSLSNSPVHLSQAQITDNPEQLWDSRINSELPESILRSQNNLPDPIINSEMSENRGSKPSSTGDSSSLQTYQTVQTFHTSQIAGEEEIQGVTNVVEEVASTEVLLAEEVNENSSFDQEKPSFGKENNSAGRSIVVTESNQDGASSTIVGGDKYFGQKSYSPQKINWRWLPDGPWNVDGKLNREFQEWLAKKWMAEYNRTDIYKAKADVLLHFKKDPTNLAVWWDVYQSQYIAKARNMRTRLDNGLNISQEEQQEAIANHRAVLPMSEYQQQTTNQLSVTNYQLPSGKPENPVTAHCSLVTEITDPWEVVTTEAEVIEANPASIQNPKSKIQNEEEGRRYKDVTGIAARQNSDIPEEQRKKVMAKISEFVSGLSQKMRRQSQPQPVDPKNELESLNEMLLDPVFREDSEILGQVKRYLSNGYLADYDDAGYPISVYAF